jgi:hypothetical protein
MYFALFDLPLLKEVKSEQNDSLCCFILYLTTFDLYFNVQQDATMSSQYFILLQYHSTCFGCPLHPSSGAQETVVTATGIGHISQ